MINKRHFIIHFNLECYLKFTIRKKPECKSEVSSAAVGFPLLSVGQCPQEPSSCVSLPLPPAELHGAPPPHTHPSGQNSTAGAPRLDPDIAICCPLCLPELWPRGNQCGFRAWRWALTGPSCQAPTTLSLEQEPQTELSSGQEQDFRSQGLTTLRGWERGWGHTELGLRPSLVVGPSGASALRVGWTGDERGQTVRTRYHHLTRQRGLRGSSSAVLKHTGQ